MIEDLYLISICIIYAAIGSLARALLGLYKAYTTTVDFRLNMKRIIVEICCSILLGTFGVIILSGIKGFDYELKIAALIAGFLGADISNLITKKVGLTKGLEIRLTDEQVALYEFNPRQVNALRYLKSHKRITNKMYQELNQTSPITAKRDLVQLVRKGKLRKSGKGRAIYYTLA